MLQPVLVPCKRSADLVLSLDPSDSGMASIYWGTALLQRIPCDGSHPLLRLTAGLLYNLRFPVRKLAACLPLCDKTIRSIGLALRDSSSSEVVQAILGQTGEETLSEDQKQYVRVRYVELRETCRDFRRKIGEEVNRIWGVAVCGEVLRKCFREADAARDRAALCVLPPAVEEAPAGQAEASEQGGSASGGEGLAAALPEPSVETEKGNRGCASDPSPSTVSRNGSSPSEDDDGGEDTAPAAEPAPPCLETEKGNRGCASDPSSSTVSRNGSSPSEDDDGSEDTVPAAEPAPPCLETEKGNRGCASDPSPSTVSRNGSSPSEVGTDDGEPPACQDADADGRDGRIERETGAELPGASVPAPWPLPFPYLPERPQWCAHAGLFTLLPWLEQGLGDAPAEVQQLALQILAGAVNHEGSRYTSFDSLKLLGEPVHRAIRSQRAWCKAHAFDGVLETVLLGNARLAWLHYERVFYFDPHTERYTGLLKTLLAWCGSLHGIAKGLHLDFIHTPFGFPCHIRHFDNYEDMRRRFLVSREQFRALFGICGPVTWVADRGIWSKEFLADLAALLDRFVTWEKGYCAESQSAWEERFTASGKFSKWRCRNNRQDRYRYVFRWREQPWNVVPNGRRFIVRARKPGGATIEVSIVSNDPNLAPERIIWLMFNRWVQENDFAYLRRHFGIDELTERGFERYADIASELQDRPVESRQYKRAREQVKQLEGQLAAALIDRRAVGEVQDSAALRHEGRNLRRQLARLRQQLEQLRVGDTDSAAGARQQLARIEHGLKQTAQAVRDRQAEEARAAEAATLEARTREVEENIRQLTQRLEAIPRQESRLAVLVEEHVVRLRMRAKPLVDAVRITCRNVFRRPLDIFRPIFDNRRTDHAVLRSITRAPGLVCATPERIDVRLLPAMTIEPAERERIRTFLDICEHRAAEMNALRDGPALRFHLLLDEDEITRFLRDM